jgi:hypothetical protein
MEVAMPITIDEPFIRRVLSELQAIRFSGTYVLGGGPEGMALNSLQVVPGHEGWATAQRLTTSVQNTGNSLDRRVDGLGTELDQRIHGLTRYLAATDEVEALNSANAHDFANHFSSGGTFGTPSASNPPTSTTNSPTDSTANAPETQD